MESILTVATRSAGRLLQLLLIIIQELAARADVIVSPVSLLQHNADGTFTELATHHEVVPESRESEDIDEDINEIPRPRSPRQPDFPPDYKEAPWKKSRKE